MVDFTLTDEQLALRELAHDFAEQEIRPVAWEYDRDATFPQAIIEKAWELGLMNTHIPEHYGGPAIGYLDGTIIEEELSWGCSGIQTSLGCNGLATAPIALGGSEEIKKKYADKRRTKVVGNVDEPEFGEEDFIVAEDADIGAAVQQR